MNILTKINEWADSKTQEEFNDFFMAWVITPLFLLIGVLIMTINNIGGI